MTPVPRPQIPAQHLLSLLEDVMVKALLMAFPKATNPQTLFAEDPKAAMVCSTATSTTSEQRHLCHLLTNSPFSRLHTNSDSKQHELQSNTG